MKPEGALSTQDFEAVASVIDPFIEAEGHLKGIIIQTETFPGWESFAALTQHIKFVKDHHQKVGCIAVVTDSVLGNFAEIIASHFVSADIKHFPFAELAQAEAWILNARSE